MHCKVHKELDCCAPARLRWWWWWCRCYGLSVLTMPLRHDQIVNVIIHGVCIIGHKSAVTVYFQSEKFVGFNPATDFLQQQWHRRDVFAAFLRRCRCNFYVSFTLRYLSLLPFSLFDCKPAADLITFTVTLFLLSIHCYSSHTCIQSVLWHFSRYAWVIQLYL